MFRREILKPCDHDTPCDGCGVPLWEDEPAFVDLEAGTLFCSRECGRRHQEWERESEKLRKPALTAPAELL